MEVTRDLAKARCICEVIDVVFFVKQNEHILVFANDADCVVPP